MLSGLFTNNLTLEIVQVKPAIDAPVGYMFASAGASLMSQEQRWVLYKEYKNSEGTAFLLRKPSLSSHRYTSLAEWQAAVASNSAAGIWKDDATYAMVHATAFDSLKFTTAAPVKPLSPAHGPQLKAPPVKHKPGGGHPRGPDKLTTWVRPSFQLMDRVAITQLQDVTAYAYGTKWEPVVSPSGDHDVNQEYWVLLPTYKHPLGQKDGQEIQTATTITDVEGATDSVKAFLDDMENKWQPGSALITASATYLKERPEIP